MQQFSTKISALLILSGFIVVLLTLFPALFLPGADLAFGPVQCGLFMAGVGLVIFGFDFACQKDQQKLDFWHFTLRQAGIFIPWIGGGIFYAAVVFLSPHSASINKNLDFLQIMAGLLIAAGIMGRSWQILKHTHPVDVLRTRLAHARYLRWGILWLLLSIFLAFYSDIVRGGLLVFSAFFLIGLGPALFLFSPAGRNDFAVAFAPVVGFALIAVIGSWLVILDLPVQKWALPVTVMSVLISSMVIWLQHKHFRVEWQSTKDWDLLHEIGLTCGVMLLTILPVAIGGLKFSVFRGNPVDARNYMAMAAFLDSIPFSERGQTQMLFNSNPALLLAATSLHTRWATSMLMAYVVQVSHIPLYRFDFAFTALPFALAFAPVRIFLRSRSMDLGNISLMALSISTGYYAQVVLDSRAVSYATAIPVLISLVLLAAKILDDDQFYYRHWPICLGEAFLMIIFIAALTVLYIEIFVLLIFGMSLSVLFYALNGILPLKKLLVMLVCSVAGVMIVGITSPFYITFFMSQIKNSQQLFVSWHIDYFPWIFEDAPAGVWGLNPYQLSPLLSTFLHGVGYLLLFFLLIGLVPLFSFAHRLTNFFRLNALLTFGGILIFTYAFFRGQFFQAGKFITYLYPFLMLYMGTLPSVFKEVNRSETFSRFSVLMQITVSLWLVSQVMLAGYRFYVTAKGFEYPFHVQHSGNSVKTYATKYAWNISPFVEQIQKVENPVVWVSTGNVMTDSFWALILNQKARVLAVQPLANLEQATKLLSNSDLPSLPDFLIISNSIWGLEKLGSSDWKLLPTLYQDEQYSLIKIGRIYPEHMLLIGIRSDPTYVQFQVNPELIISNNADGNSASLVFLSPEACHVTISADIYIYPPESTISILQAEILPSGKQSRFEVRNEQNVEILLDLNKGYNLVPIKAVSSISSEMKTLTIGSTNLHFINADCNDK